MNFPRVAALRQPIAKAPGHCHGEWTSTFVDSGLCVPHFHEMVSNSPLYVFVRKPWFPVHLKHYAGPTETTGSSLRLHA
jgi:hypothetical protein